MHPSLRSYWLLFYLIVGTIHLILAIGLHLEHPYGSIFKCLLAPTLIGWLIQIRCRPWSLVIALIGCFFGDLLLELPNEFFIPGMVSFACAHVAFIYTFLQRDAKLILRMKPWIILPYLTCVGVTLWYAWFGLEVMLRLAAPVYACLLTGTATTAAARSIRGYHSNRIITTNDGQVIYDPTATNTSSASSSSSSSSSTLVSFAQSLMCGLGGCMFMASDGMILLRQAEKISSETALCLIMPLYIVAILFLTIDVVLYDQSNRTRRSINGLDEDLSYTVPVGGFEPTEPTNMIGNEYTNMNHAYDEDARSYA